MKTVEIDALEVVQLRPRLNGMKLGKVVGVRNGDTLVDYEGNPYGALPARVGVAVPVDRLDAAYEQSLDVLLAFADQDPTQPIVIDLIQPKATRASDSHADVSASPSPRKETTVFTNQRVVSELANCELRVASISAVDRGIVLIDFEGNENGPCQARSTVPLRNLRDPVLTAFLPGGDAIIVGQVYAEVPVSAESTESRDVTIKGERVVIEATTELVMLAGTCKIHLDARGKAVILADQVVSRARGTNKVQGGSVQLN